MMRANTIRGKVLLVNARYQQKGCSIIMTTSDAQQDQKEVGASVLVWDLPLRLFHWSLAGAVIVSVASAKANQMVVHEKSGLTILGLIVFRLIWGFFGSSTALFSHFIKGPSSVLKTVKALINKNSDTQSGHSALGGWAVLALLGITLYMPLTGMLSSDDILYDGPLAFLLPDLTRTLTRLHHNGQFILFALIALHLSAMVVYYLRLKMNLLPAMITGRRRGATGSTATLSVKRRRYGLLLLLACVAVAHLIVLLSPPDFF